MKDLFIDIEALGRRSGCAPIQLGAIVFDPATGKTAEEFHCFIAPYPRFHVDLSTLDWHREHGTYPHPEGVAVVDLMDAMNDFSCWVAQLESVGHVIEEWWSWGIAYDFPILEPVFDHALNGVTPWSYWQPSDARTIWKLAFPGIRHGERPHHALEDCRHGIKDLCAALRELNGGQELRDVVKDLVAWNEKYPSSRIYGESAIRQIAAEMDRLHARAAAVLGNLAVEEVEE